MLLKAAIVLLGVTLLQVSAENFPTEFIENVIAKESRSSASSRIVSGWEALPGQHPHHVSLRQVGPTGGVSACGGSLVSREWVVSAAHCTAGRITLVVRAGVVSLTTPAYIHETTEWYNHPTFNDNNPDTVQPNDIAIVKLQRPVTYSRLVQPIRIQSSADQFRNYAGEQVHASGHGRTWTSGSQPEVLQWVYLRAVSNADCARIFGAIITDNTVCAQFFNVTSQSTCQGDSGGPLVHVDTEGVPHLIGVTSFVAGGTWGCHSGLPAGFIRTGPFLPWFEEVTGIDFENLNEEDEEESAPEEEETDPEEEETDPEEEETGPEDEETGPEEEETGPEEEETDPEEDSEPEEDSDEDDQQVSELLKRLEVSVKVKVRFNKYKVKKEVEKEKEISA